ncbi:MAG: AraC family transcriptional regulator [Bryobacteraceae bacterium]|nr:AraC family transcriptional regulator [Bryobacteraceae bacterium]
MAFANATAPSFGFEALELTEVLSRVAEDHFATPRRLAFYQILLLKSGEARYEVDFIPYKLRAGLLAFTKPGQVQRLPGSRGCHGRLLVFEPSFLSNGVHAPGIRRIAPILEAAPDVVNAFDRLFQEYSEGAGHPIWQSVLFHEIAGLLLRMQRQSESAPARTPGESNALLLFERFEDLLDEAFAEHRSVSELARRLGCSEKTLSRACMLVAESPPKSLIQRRLALEAKRLLAHTDLPVKEVSAQLGFSESTNFVKFFRKIASELPTAFRLRSQVGLVQL